MENILDPNEHEDKSENENHQPESSSGNEEFLLINPSVSDEGEEASEEDFGDDEDFGSEDDHDPMDNYGSSGEKYGWYNGFSDDAIDDAFEGDPSNTWNVD
jgi:hypothetical protein